jgi:hypothetical protein
VGFEHVQDFLQRGDDREPAGHGTHPSVVQPTQQ